MVLTVSIFVQRKITKQIPTDIFCSYFYPTRKETVDNMSELSFTSVIDSYTFIAFTTIFTILTIIRTLLHGDLRRILLKSAKKRGNYG
jgi:hypothetical protein